SPINFTVVFDKPINTSTLTSGDVTTVGTATFGTKTITITPIAPNNGTTFNVAIGGMTGNGTVTATVPAGGVSDPAGNTNNASTSTDNTVTYDATPPTAAVTYSPTGGVEAGT